MSSPPFARAGILALLAAAPTACFAPRPQPDDWMAYGFRSPEETFRSFLTALAGDRPELEYRCLSQALKRREGGTLLGYMRLRDELFDEMPWLKAAARAEVEQVEPLGRDRARVHARVDWLFWDEAFEVVLVSEEYFELYRGAERVEDGFHAFAPQVQGEVLLAAVPAPTEVGLAEITEIRHGREWKIDAIRPPGAPPSP